jgi:uracil-DNA glycosylase
MGIKSQQLKEDDRRQKYQELVARRKKCNFAECAPLVNPSKIAQGKYDSDEIGSWTLWQGGLDARIMVVGQDWGNVKSFEDGCGFPTSGNRLSKTNKSLISHLKSIGIDIPECDKNMVGSRLFFTNAVLCIKPGKQDDSLSQGCANKCTSTFLRPLIELIEPSVVITLSVRAYRGVRKAFGLTGRKTPYELTDAINKHPCGIDLSESCVLFPMYHCGAWGHKTRPEEQQAKDWARVKKYIISRNLDV